MPFNVGDEVIDLGAAVFYDFERAARDADRGKSSGQYRTLLFVRGMLYIGRLWLRPFHSLSPRLVRLTWCLVVVVADLPSSVVWGIFQYFDIVGSAQGA